MFDRISLVISQNLSLSLIKSKRTMKRKSGEVGYISPLKPFGSYFSILSKVLMASCEGCFCDGTTWRVEGDHYVGLDLKKGVAEPKIQPRALNSAQGLMGYFPRIFRSQDHKSPNKFKTRTRRLIKTMLSIKSPKNSC